MSFRSAVRHGRQCARASIDLHVRHLTFERAPSRVFVDQVEATEHENERANDRERIPKMLNHHIIPLTLGAPGVELFLDQFTRGLF